MSAFTLGFYASEFHLDCLLFVPHIFFVILALALGFFTSKFHLKLFVPRAGFVSSDFNFKLFVPLAFFVFVKLRNS